MKADTPTEFNKFELEAYESILYEQGYFGKKPVNRLVKTRDYDVKYTFDGGGNVTSITDPWSHYLIEVLCK